MAGKSSVLQELLQLIDIYFSRVHCNHTGSDVVTETKTTEKKKKSYFEKLSTPKQSKAIWLTSFG